MKPIFQAHTCLSEQDIRKYLDGQLDAAARHRVENHLLDCPLCEDALEGYELMRQATPKPVAQSQPLRAVRGGRLSLVRIAASLLFVIASVLIYYFVFTTPNPENLYQAYYEPYESEMMQLFRQGASPADAEENAMEQAIRSANEAYEAGDFEKAAQQLEEILDANPEKQILHFYLGIAHLETDDFPAAVESFKAAQDSVYLEEANWYLALAYLKQQQPELAKDILSGFANNPQSRYYEKAKDLVSKL